MCGYIKSLNFRTCFIYPSNIERSSKIVSTEDRDLIFLKKNILISEGAPCYPQHMVDHRLEKNAIDKIAPFSIRNIQFNSTDVQLMINKSQMPFEQRKRFDFDSPASLSDDEYKILTGLTKVQFDDLAQNILNYSIRNSSNRSIRTALAILLCKLRLGLSISMLAVLFQLPDKKTVSRSLKIVRTALLNEFVSSNLGFNHVRGQKIIHQHISAIAQQLMFTNESDTAIIVINGTYLNIQVKKNISLF